MNLENDLSVRFVTAAGSLKDKPAEQRTWAEGLSDTELDWVVEHGVEEIAAPRGGGDSSSPDAESVAQLVRIAEQLYQERSPDAM